jgi:hypothetical protein
MYIWGEALGERGGALGYGPHRPEPPARTTVSLVGDEQVAGEAWVGTFLRARAGIPR